MTGGEKTHSYHKNITPGTCTTGIRVGCSSWGEHPK
jgi:hypothetical protein